MNHAPPHTGAPEEKVPSFVTFELCAETLDACRAANEAGADRIELCVNLHLQGTTAPEPLIADAVASSQVPVHILVRPDAGDFVYQAERFRVIRDQIRAARVLGAAGIVVVVVNPDRSVAIGPMQELVTLAAPLPVEFHRAFDECPDLEQALEDSIVAGCKRVLTSGGAPDVITGAASLARLVRQAAGRIEIAAGGGLRVVNVQQLAAAWGGQHYHGSLGGAADGVPALAQRIRTIVSAIRAAEPL